MVRVSKSKKTAVLAKDLRCRDRQGAVHIDSDGRDFPSIEEIAQLVEKVLRAP